MLWVSDTVNLSFVPSALQVRPSRNWSDIIEGPPQLRGRRQVGDYHSIDLP